MAQVTCWALFAAVFVSLVSIHFQRVFPDIHSFSDIVSTSSTTPFVRDPAGPDLDIDIILPEMTQTPLIKTCKACYDLIQEFLNDPVPYTSKRTIYPSPDFHDEELHLKTQEQVRDSISVLEEVLDLYTLEELAISYNGGKDCLVMLIIYMSTIYSKYLDNLNELTNQKLHSVYVNSETTFPEQDEFLEWSTAQYHLNITKYQNTLKQGFQEYLDTNPNIKSIMVGIRKIDPYGAKLTPIMRTDHGWPDFVRIHPILEFTTCEIWYFLKCLDVRYCSLYDHGYTSLGGINNTIPNPLLKIEGGGHLPAYMMFDDEHERLSRTSDLKNKKKHDEKL